MSEPAAAWALCSGGKDSVATAHYLRSLGKLSGLVHLGTGIAVPGAEEFVARFADRLGVPFECHRTPVSFEWLVRRYGFPAPESHGRTVNYLKGRGVRQFKKAHPGEWLASGVRRAESHRRRLTTREFGMWERVPTWAPIFDWTTAEVWAYVAENRLEVSQAYRELHISGDCLCGAFARREEGYLLRTFYPEIAERIRTLESETGQRWGGWSEGVSAPQTRLEAFACAECPLEAEGAPQENPSPSGNTPGAGKGSG